MERTWKDELDRPWLVEVDVPEVAPDLEVEEAATELVFTRDGEVPRSLGVMGPIQECFDDLDDGALQHALDAASSATGLLLVDDEGTLWWVRRPDGGRRSTLVEFSDGERTFRYEGALPDDPERLGEDHLLELLDDARGRIMEPMDLRV